MTSTKCKNKVAVVNRTNLKNYGSLLQSYALCKAVESLGYDCEIIWEQGTLNKNYDFRLRKLIISVFKLLFHPKLLKSTFGAAKYVSSSPIDEEVSKKFDAFSSNHMKVKYYSHIEMKKAARETYTKLICGSDQVWCSTTLYVDPLMYLRFAPKNKRIAYAPSFGRDFIPNYNWRKMRRYINDIPFVSVRESIGQRLIKELTGRDVPVLVDPTLLIPVKDWDELKISQTLTEPYILCYFLSTPTQATQDKLLSFFADKGTTIVALNCRLEHLEKKNKVVYPDCGPGEFIGYLSDADYVFTDSYHGMLFSIMYQKEFWSVEREYGDFDQSSRQCSLLDMLGLMNRYVGKNETIFSDPIDYNLVNARLNRKIQESIKYLKEALEA